MSFASRFVALVALPVAITIMATGAVVACSAPEIPNAPLASSKKTPAKKEKPGSTSGGGGTNSGGNGNKDKTTTPADPGSPAPPPAPDGAPTLTSVSPDAITIGSSPNGAELTLTGTKFAEGSNVDLAGTKIPTTFVSGTSLKVKIPADKLTTAGTIRLAVEKGGVQSNGLSFTIANPTNVTITDLQPKQTTLAANQTPVTISVTGTGFVQASQVRFNGAQVQTTFNSSTSLNASIPGTALVDAGKFSVTVANGADVISLPTPFEVQNPSPSTNGITPKTVAANSGALAVTISGSGFSKGSTVLAGNTPLATTFVSFTSIRATVPSNLLTQSGATVRLTVQTGAPGGGTSEAQTITVTAQAGGTTGGTSGGTSNNSNPANCAYLCADYNYSPGQCFQGYYCIESGTYAGCLGQTTCDDTPLAGGGGGGGGGGGEVCQYSCADYNYAYGECYQDFYCSPASGCLIEAICE